MSLHPGLLKCLTIFSIGLLFVSCGEEKKVEELLRPVRYQTAFSTVGVRRRTFSGVAQAGLESRLSFKISGTVERLSVKVGEEVSEGKLIASVEATDYQLQVQQAQASLVSAQAQERNAEASYNRVRQLYESRNASRNDLDAARAAFESSTAQVVSLRKQLELSRSRLSYTNLRSPISGAIATVNVEVGENVQAGQTIIQVSSGTNLEVEVTIPEILISQIREGQEVTVEFDALPNRKFTARVTEVSVTATGFATTYPVTLRLTEESPDVRSGMAAEVAFEFGANDQRERIVVPSFSVGDDRTGRYVYTVEASEEEGVGVVKRNAVSIGEFTEDGIEIMDGLSDGSYVVTAGISKLTDGQRGRFDIPGQN